MEISEDTHMICRNSIKGNKNRYESMTNKSRKAVSKAMRVNAEQGLTVLKNVKMECLVYQEDQGYTVKNLK